jgi:hypothetical protein
VAAVRIKPASVRVRGVSGGEQQQRESARQDAKAYLHTYRPSDE